MTEIKPFRAFVYNQDKISDLSKVVCPPYDVISPSQQSYFMNASPYNLIHVLLSKDSAVEDKYILSGKKFRKWIEDEVLIQDSLPAVYFYSQQYNFKGEKRQRLGFIALMRLADDDTSIYKHEHTRLEPKEDRLKLLMQTEANLSPIFAIFSDQKRVINKVYEKYAQKQKPCIDVVDLEHTRHKLWRIDDPALISDIQSKVSSENIFIADGHHRYEVACAWREEMRKRLGQLRGDESCNYVLTYFTNTQIPGLTILPIHRLVKPVNAFRIDDFNQRLGEYFDVEFVKDKSRFLFLMQKAIGSSHVIGMCHNGKFWLLRLKNVLILDKVISDKQKDYRLLDVSVFNYIILKNILGMDIEDKKNILFHHDADELIQMAGKDDSQIAFLLAPAKMTQIMSVALSGQRMPSKSTYFYPKVLSGLVINKL